MSGSFFVFRDAFCRAFLLILRVTKILHFVDGLHIIKDNLFPLPPLFSMIQKQSGTAWREMYQVFNMGHRFEIYTSEAIAKEVIDISSSFNIDARIVGRVEAADRAALTIESDKGSFHY